MSGEAQENQPETAGTAETFLEINVTDAAVAAIKTRCYLPITRPPYYQKVEFIGKYGEIPAKGTITFRKKC